MKDNSALELDAVIKAILAPFEGETPGDFLKNLQPGDVLAGRVLKIESDGRALMALGNSRVLAQIGFEAKVGQVLTLQVVETGPVLHLRSDGLQRPEPPPAFPKIDLMNVLAPSPRRRMVRLADRIGRQPDIPAAPHAVSKSVRAAFTMIGKIFTPVSLEESPERIARNLKALVEDGGALFEKRLADAAAPASAAQGAQSGNKPLALTAAAVSAKDIKAHLLLLKNFLSDMDSRQHALLKLSGVEDGGALFEKRLADASASASAAQGAQSGNKPLALTAAAVSAKDIKAHLLLLKSFLSDMDSGQQALLKLSGKEADFMRQSISKLLGHVEEQQQAAVARWKADPTQQVFVHMMPVQGQREPVAIRVRYPSKRSAGHPEDNRHHIALLLQMDRLGAVRVDLSLLGGVLKIGFFVASDAVKAKFEEALGAVRENLAGHFEQMQLSVFVACDKIEQFYHEGARRTPAGRVDLIA